MSFGEAAKDAHPKAGKRWSQDVIGHVAPELSTYDLAQSLTYGGAFGPDMAKQTVTEPGLLATTEDELRATAVEAAKRAKVQKELARSHSDAA
jgi:hypothetical protein